MPLMERSHYGVLQGITRYVETAKYCTAIVRTAGTIPWFGTLQSPVPARRNSPAPSKPTTRLPMPLPYLLVSPSSSTPPSQFVGAP